MIDPEKYISDGLRIIKQLVGQNNLTQALKACEELLRVNPYHKGVKNMLEEVQSKILKQNSSKVDADIAATIHLWDEKRYGELATIYAKLYQYLPEHKGLKKMMQKLQDTITSTQLAQKKDFFSQAYDAITALIKDGKFADAIQACTELLQLDPLNNKAQQLLLASKDKLIEAKLEENRAINESSDFERAIELYESLLAINPKNNRAQKLLVQAKSHFAEKKVLADRIHFNESIQRMKELFNAGEYEKVKQACDEIERLDPKNMTAKLFNRKARAIILKEIELLEVQRLEEQQAVLKLEYNKNPAAFVRL